MIMAAGIKMGIAGTNAVKKLRLEKLNKGLPFMINSRELPGEQCYLEYPTGVIKLVRISRSTRDFITLRELSQNESLLIRRKFHLS